MASVVFSWFVAFYVALGVLICAEIPRNKLRSIIAQITRIGKVLGGVRVLQAIDKSQN